MRVGKAVDKENWRKQVGKQVTQTSGSSYVILSLKKVNCHYYLPYLPLPNKADYLPPNPKNKKEQVWGLVSDGKFTTGQITSVVHTTKDYVWKETSRLKSKTVASLIVNRSTTEL